MRPKRFVLAAVLTLVAGGFLAAQGDSLMGAEFQVSPQNPPIMVPPIPVHEDPDVAHDATTGIYLVAWVRHNSATGRDIVAQRFANDGTPVGSLLLIDSGPLVGQPAVGNVNQTDTFLVTWTRGLSAGGTTLMARSVVAQAGGLSPQVILAAGASFPYTVDNLAPRVGGDARASFVVGLSFNDAIVVWQEVGANGSRIRACEVLCAPLAAPVMTTLPFYVSNATTDSFPDITRHGGNSGQWLVAWQRAFAGHAGHDIVARVIGSNGSLCTLETAVTFTTFFNEERPSVARETQSPDFMVVFQREGNLGSGDFGIQCRGVSLSGSCFGGGSLAMTTAVTDFAMQPALNEINPIVEFAGSKYMVVWAEEDISGNAHLRLRNVAPDTCAYCGPTWAVGTGSVDARNAAIGAQNSSSLLGGDEALIVWDNGGNDDIRGQRAAALGAGGAVLPYAPACGGGGTCGISGPSTLGNLDFAITLTGADPAATLAYLALSPAALNFPCGSCTLVPTLDFVFLTLPVTNGSATLPLPLPCHPVTSGIDIYAQWIVLGTAASPCNLAPNASLSSAVRVFIIP